jgi:adenylate cyclase, class 2
MRILGVSRIGRDRVPRPPHIEVEVRFRLPEPSAALASLRAVGVRFGKPEMQHDQAYAPAGWDYSKSRIGVTFARLRTSNGKHLFTVKRPVTDVRTCIEHECFISDRESMHEAILLMGFEPTIRIVKSRAIGRLRDLTFCLDEVEGLGRFLEVERLASAEDDTDAARLEIEAFMRQLGVSAERCYDTYDALLNALPRPVSRERRHDFVAA